MKGTGVLRLLLWLLLLLIRCHEQISTCSVSTKTTLDFFKLQYYFANPPPAGGVTPVPKAELLANTGFPPKTFCCFAPKLAAAPNLGVAVLKAWKPFFKQNITNGVHLLL